MTTNNKKYKIRRDLSTGTIDGRVLYRIEALRNVGLIFKKGDIGGYIESEDNLSHKGSCWVYNNAMVYGNAWVHGEAEIAGYARVFGNARVCGYARVYENAQVFKHAFVCERAQISGNANVGGYANVDGETCLFGYARVSGGVRLGGKWIYGPDPEVDFFPSPVYYKKKL